MHRTVEQLERLGRFCVFIFFFYICAIFFSVFPFNTRSLCHLFFHRYPPTGQKIIKYNNIWGFLFPPPSPSPPGLPPPPKIIRSSFRSHACKDEVAGFNETPQEKRYTIAWTATLRKEVSTAKKQWV